MRKTTRVAALFAAVTFTLLLPATAALASEGSGCSGTAISKDSSGATLETAHVPGAAASQDMPFLVDPRGTVDWSGSTDQPITGATWSVTVMGVPFLNGTFQNDAKDTTTSGTTDIASLPDAVTWAIKGHQVIPVSGTITGAGGTCTLSGYITGQGDPASSPMFYAGATFVVAGTALAAAAAIGTKIVGASAAGGTIAS